MSSFLETFQESVKLRNENSLWDVSSAFLYKFGSVKTFQQRLKVIDTCNCDRIVVIVDGNGC